MGKTPPSFAHMYTNTELVAKVCGLGVSFAPYAVAMTEDSGFDGARLASFSKTDFALLLALIPKVHRARLEPVFFMAADGTGSGNSQFPPP